MRNKGAAGPAALPPPAVDPLRDELLVDMPVPGLDVEAGGGGPAVS